LNVPGTSPQSWTGLNVSFSDLLNALATQNQAAFNNLFFGGDDTVGYVLIPGTYTYLSGYGGDDVFTLYQWDPLNLAIDGGNGNDTLNVTGGIPAIGGGVNFSVSGIETINLGAGFDYAITANTDLFAASNTVTINGSALGAHSKLSFTLTPSALRTPSPELWR
jgi:hypothetical protein